MVSYLSSARLAGHTSVCLDVLSGVAGVLPTQLVNCLMRTKDHTSNVGAGVARSLGWVGGGRGSDTILASELVYTPTCLLKDSKL